ncbi:MAG: hypothetical protein Q9190_001522 [Brigantiaea leucoxantha]
MTFANLNAVISTAPETFLIEEAQTLDAERRKSGPRSKLHGMPILLKAKEDAAIPLLLRKAGAIIIAKANLSIKILYTCAHGYKLISYQELGNAIGYNITAGWSPTQTPYFKGGVDPKGKWLGHSVRALLLYLTAAILPGSDFEADSTTSWEGVVPDFDKQSRDEIRNALAKTESLGARIMHDAPLLTLKELVDKGAPSASSLRTVTVYETRLTLENFFVNFKSPAVHTLENLIQFGKDHAEEELPNGFNQDHLEAAAKSTMTPEEFECDFELVMRTTRENVENCLSATNADFIIASGESVQVAIHWQRPHSASPSSTGGRSV